VGRIRGPQKVFVLLPPINRMIRLFFSFFFFVFLYIFSANAAGAQSADLILTWQARNYYPSDYAGKALATRGTPISVAVELVEDGKLQDLSSANFTWYVDERIHAREVGRKEILFPVSNPVGDDHFVRVIVQRGGNSFESSVQIPVLRQELVLERPTAGGDFIRAGAKVVFRAVPYFFNITSFDDLSFTWQTDTTAPQSLGSDNVLALTIAPLQEGEFERSTLLMVSAQNVVNLLEFAKERVRLKIR
jgi:hypothetical protein